MTIVLDSPVSVVDALRGDRTVRPLLNHASASGLRAQLEDGIYDVLGALRLDHSIVVRAASLRQTPDTANFSASTHGRLRGVLINQALRLMSVGVRIDSAFDDVVLAWRGESATGELIDVMDHLDNDERARLATDVTAHVVTLARSLGEVPGRWMPRSSVRAVQTLGGGNVILRDVVDLMIGTTGGDVASVALFDVTTSPLGEGAERAMRFHALVQTLRTSTMPLRTAAYSSATGDIWISDVDEELLQRSVNEVVACIRQMRNKQ
jgi:hypothetical protein